MCLFQSGGITVQAEQPAMLSMSFIMSNHHFSSITWSQNQGLISAMRSTGRNYKFTSKHKGEDTSYEQPQSKGYWAWKHSGSSRTSVGWAVWFQDKSSLPPTKKVWLKLWFATSCPAKTVICSCVPRTSVSMESMIWAVIQTPKSQHLAWDHMKMSLAWIVTLFTELVMSCLAMFSTNAVANSSSKPISLHPSYSLHLFDAANDT